MWNTEGATRRAGFLLLSGYYAFTYLGWFGLAFTLAFCAIGYALARFVEGQSGRLRVAAAAFTLLFVYARGYSFLRVALPDALIIEALATAGLSFLFFKTLHVVIDVSGGTLECPPFPSYLAYCLNFTTFLLGPIQRYQDFDAQWSREKEALAPDFDSHHQALNRILRGLVKKFVLAEAIALFALSANSPVESMALLDIQLRTYVFYFFLYLDFSGYCDVVIGVGSLMGIRPPENFNLPFLSPNVSAYWLRVHESLTRWLTDYVFSPSYAWALRSPRFGPGLGSMVVAVIITMLATGLWHGATLSFVLFGLVHALYMVAFRTFEHVMVRTRGRKGLKALRANRAWYVVSTLVTFHFTASAYLFFVLDNSQVVALALRLLP